MKLRIEIDMDGAAFETLDASGEELRRLLSRVTYALQDESRLFEERVAMADVVLLDSNGNTCGKVEVVP